MKILIIGDIFGQEGKFAIQQYLPSMKESLNPDLVIANAENVSKGGKSLTKDDYDLLLAAGVDYFTMGNHTFKNPELETYINKKNNIVRPGNAWVNKPGKGYIIFEHNNKKILLLNILGSLFIPWIDISSPFKYCDDILDNNDYDLAIVDFHAEATSEKVILANYISKKEKPSIVFGTHTHIQTSDERIMNHNTAYITDVGMTGVFNSAIGVDFEAVTNKLVYNKREKFVEAKGPVRINAILVTLFANTLKPTKIERIIINP